MTANEATPTNQLSQPQTGLMTSYGRSGEQALVAAAQVGITEAMNELLVRHRASLYRAARRFARSHEDAEDLVQDAMMRAFVNLHRFRNECQFGTWLIAIVNNAGLSMKRKQKKTFFMSLESNARDEDAARPARSDIPDSSRGPEETALQQELLAVLQSIVLRQSRTHQMILQRCVFDEVCIAEGASSLGITIGSAKSSLYRARRRVSESFERRGFVRRRKIPTMRAR